MGIKRKRFDVFLILIVLLATASNTLAKWGSSSRGSSSRSSYSRSSPSYSRPSPSYSSYSRPSPSYSSYSRPSPSYSSYSRPSPSYPSYSRPAPSPAHLSYPSYYRPAPAPSYSRPAATPSYSYTSSKPSPSPSYGWNVGSPSSGNPSFGSASSKPASSNVGWNVGSGSTSTVVKPPSSNIGWNTNTNTAQKPASTNYGWNVTPKPSAPVVPPPAYPGLHNKPAPSNNAPPAYYPSYNNPPSYSQNYHTQPSYSPSYHSQPSYSPSYHSSPSYRPGSHSYKPSYSPSYSPSYNNRKSYATESSIPRHSVSNAYAPNSGYQPHNNYYGSTFGRQGLPGNTYLSNNYYGYKKSGSSGFLTNALFLGGGLAGGYALGRYTSRNGEEAREWGEDDDKRWRATTKAPYFENKIPGEDKVLPASAVIGAATAFGLVSLLPLNVPKGMPLMYCNDTYLMQSHIQINGGNIYQCVNNTIQIWCPQKFEEEIVTTKQPIVTTEQPMVITEDSYTSNVTEVISSTESMSENPEIIDPKIVKREVEQTEQLMCINKTMECDLADGRNSENIYCSNGNLFSTATVFCNSTTILNGQISILNCYDGQLPEKRAAFIPTTAQPPVATTEKPLSFGQKVSKFFRKLFGMEAKSETTTQAPTEAPQLEADSWYPEALTIPPEVNETTTVEVSADSTTEAPFKWMKLVQVKFENGTEGTKLEPVPIDTVKFQEEINERISTLGNKIEGNPAWIKVYKTNPVETTTTSESSTISKSSTVPESTTKIEELDF